VIAPDTLTRSSGSRRSDPVARGVARAASLVCGALVLAAGALAGDVVAVRAGLVVTMTGASIENGVVLVDDGKIVAVGAHGSVVVPVGARTVDYGASAVLLPGFVAADSRYGAGFASGRTADPGVLAVDNFDPYTTFHGAVTNGVTTLYMAPARGRLVAGQGAVVKSAGAPEARVLKRDGILHGSISDEARQTPGYWEPRVPATVDVGLGVEAPQLPRTTMGAILALDELLRFATGDSSLASEYGAVVGRELTTALRASAVWRMGAETEGEVRALLDFFATHRLPLVLEGAGGAKALAADIAKAGVPVIVRPTYRGGVDIGKSPDTLWPDNGLVAALLAAGVKVAIAAPAAAGTDDLLFGLALAIRGEVAPDAAIRTITVNAAEVLGVGDRVGSLAPGKDADFAVFSAAPLAGGGSPIATWIDGNEVWNLQRDALRLAQYSAERAGRSTTTARVVPSTVLSVEELHLGDGHILAPGELLMRNGKIVEVGTRVGRPAGSVVVHGKAAMPGMIDALGFLGLEGSARPFSSRADNTRILTPGDRVDRKVAQHGVTTVHLGSRNITGATTPTLAYKPAASTFEGLVVDPAAAVRMRWTEEIVAESGNAVRQTLAKAVEYKQKWDKYAEDLAKWKPPAAGEAPAEGDAAAEGDKPAEGDAKPADEAKPEEKKEKKKKGERDPARPVTGVFEGTSKHGEDSQPVRFQLNERADGTIEGFVRTVHHSELLPVSGRRDGYDVTLTAESPERVYSLKLAQVFSNDPTEEKKGAKKGSGDDDKGKEGEKPKPEEKKDPAPGGGGGSFQEPEGEKKPDGEKKDEKKEEKEPPVEVFLRGEISVDGAVIASLDVKQTSTEYRVARRPELTRVAAPTVAEPKGKPKPPSADPDLEILRRAMAGDAAVLVEVERADQILACVKAFEDAGLKPVLVGAEGAEALAGELRGRIAGVLPPRQITRSLSPTRSVNRYAELAAAGLPIAFHSAAEEGAAELATFALLAVVEGLSPQAAIVGLTSGAAKMLGLQSRVGSLTVGLDADVLLLSASPYESAASVQRVWVNGEEIH
jgi:imidazolonepropionase-like amidohydrolase